MMEALEYHVSCIRDFWHRELKKRTVVMGIVLVLSALTGYFTCVSNPEVTNAVVEYFVAVMEQSGVVTAVGTLSAIDLLLNNWLAILLCVVYGFLPFLFLPVLILFSNAYLIGVMGAYYRINALSIPAFLAGILPHGVFELTALALGAAIGFTICLTLVKKILHTPGTPPMRELVSDGLRTLLLVVLPLLVCAAVVEAYLTPQIMELFF